VIYEKEVRQMMESELRKLVKQRGNQNVKIKLKLIWINSNSYEENKILGE